MAYLSLIPDLGTPGNPIFLARIRGCCRELGDDWLWTALGLFLLFPSSAALLRYVWRGATREQGMGRMCAMSVFLGTVT